MSSVRLPERWPGIPSLAILLRPDRAPRIGISPFVKTTGDKLGGQALLFAFIIKLLRKDFHYETQPRDSLRIGLLIAWRNSTITS